MKLEFNDWANRWGEALPIGNGHIGGMIYCNPCIERIDLSELTFFSGESSISTDNQECAFKCFYRMRKFIEKGDYKKALEISKGYIGNRNNYGTNLPVGSLIIDYGHKKEHIRNYMRELDLESGIVSVLYDYLDMHIEVQSFASHPDRVIVYQMNSDKKQLNLKISCAGSQKTGYEKYTDTDLVFKYYAYETMHSNGNTGTVLIGRANIDTDGRIVGNKEYIQVTDASYVDIYIGMVTDFDNSDFNNSWERLKQHQSVCVSIGSSVLKENHLRDFSTKMLRSKLYLENSSKDFLPALVSKMYQYGRYLLLSSSREDSSLPAHLQGIWNDNVACRIGWTCDMHLDINTQMNYWPAQITNLAETTEPLFRWISERLVPSGRITAKKSYGLKGWVAELVSNAWGFSAPYWASELSPCPTGGVWILTQMWEYYLFTEDRAFLEHRAYPVMREAVEFFSDYIFEDRCGYYLSGPSISPENSFVVEGNIYQISNGCTYEILMIRELFKIFIKSSKIIGLKDDLVKHIEKITSKLPPYRIKDDGSIAEWNHDYPAYDPQHRHTSHLLGLYPFGQITPQDTPDLAKAAERTIEGKLTPEDNWEDTGWARAMLILYQARLWNGDKAWENIKSMLSGLLERNYMIIHPPTRGAGAFDNVYELDGNTGLTAAIAEMLIQSHNNEIRLLPALPKEWEKGYIKGVKARGNIEFDIYWEDGILTGASAKSAIDCEVVIWYKDEKKLVALPGGCHTVINF